MTTLVVLVGLIALAWEGALAVAMGCAHGRGDGDGSGAGREAGPMRLSRNASRCDVGA
jgi:hypothetical protein